MNEKYVLITPLKNEEKTIKEVVDSVKKQTIKPFFWIIVNDGSTDSSAEILENETKGIEWIYVINKEINSSYSWLGISNVINKAMETLEKLLLLKKVGRFKYLGILDSDISIESNYFEKLIRQFDNNEKLGVISGDVLVKKETAWISEYNSN